MRRSNRARLRDRLSPLRFHRGHALVDQWDSLIAAGDRQALCASLAADHYDPAYEKSMRAVSPDVAAHFDTPALDGPALDTLADRIAAQVHAMSI